MENNEKFLQQRIVALELEVAELKKQVKILLEFKKQASYVVMMHTPIGRKL